MSKEKKVSPNLASDVNLASNGVLASLLLSGICCPTSPLVAHTSP